MQERGVRKDSDAFKPWFDVRDLAADSQLSKSDCVLVVAQRLRAGPAPHQHTEAAKWARKRIADHCRAGTLSMQRQHPPHFQWRTFASWVLSQEDWSRRDQFDDFRSSLDKHTRNGSVEATLGDLTVNASASVTTAKLAPEVAKIIKRQQHELCEAHRSRVELERENILLTAKLADAERIAKLRQQKIAGARKGGKAGKGTPKGGRF